MNKNENVRKEKLEANEVNASYVFLGVGGCGCDIVKRIAEMCHEKERENISFVCMDTDVNDLKQVKDKFPYVYTIQTSNTQTVGAFLDNDTDARRNWFPKSAVMYEKTMSEGAGQVRAISRLAFDTTIKTGAIRPLLEAIDALYLKTGKDLKQSLRCIIASSASGGTGSGMILPISMYIRDYVKETYPNSSLLTRALLLLPETLDSVIKSQTERDSQARNGYATIKELTAFMMKGSGFMEIFPELKPYEKLNVQVPIAGSSNYKQLSNLPIDFCFLMDGQNADDTTLRSYEQYREQAAIALYEQNIGPMQRKTASAEDNIIKELAKSKGKNRFGGIGAGIIRYPYEKIVEYISRDLAIDSIGGSGESSKWTKYDKLYEKYKKKSKQEGLPINQIDKKGKYYSDKYTSDSNTFAKDLRYTYPEEVTIKSNEGKEEITKHRNEYFCEAFEKHIKDEVDRGFDAEEKSTISQIDDLSNPSAYDIENMADKTTNAIKLEEILNKTNRSGKKETEARAQRIAEAVFTNEDVIPGPNASEYSLEGKYSLFYDATNDIAHPCAARNLLYELQEVVQNKIESFNSDIKSAEETIKALKTKDVDVKGYDTIVGLKGFEAAAAEDGKSKGKRKALLSELSAIVGPYCAAVNEVYENSIFMEAYTTAKKYIDAIVEQYEIFFNSFEEKVKSLEHQKQDIVDFLNGKKGDSIKNICAKEDILKKLSESAIKRISNDSSMLTPEINGKIFREIKRNAIVKVENAGIADELTFDKKQKDIFDDVLIGYFNDEVYNKCSDIDMHILKAISFEYQLTSGNYNKNDETSYIKDILKMGARIAAPSIQRMSFEEERSIARCAYNKCLLEDRNYDVKTLLESGDDTETVSKYEIKFFNALYNITPDGLKKFAAPKKNDIVNSNGGKYFRAYYEYSKHIGPDSTKDAAMSTHIDKRWDSIKEMPELDETYQKHIVNKIHKALIYGIVHGAIIHEPLSKKTNGKYVYKFTDSMNETIQLIVPNGTLCDEFYEILDALYVDAKVVENINKDIIAKKRSISIAKNCNYSETEFFADMCKFDIFDFIMTEREKKENSAFDFGEKIVTREDIKKRADLIENNKKAIAEANIPYETWMEGKNPEELREVENDTSLFAIPMVYYYSLPNSGRYESELSAMIDAVIDVFRDEYKVWEKEEDVKFVLCDRLVSEYRLIVRNLSKYTSFEKLNIPKEEDNEVLKMVKRKIEEEIQRSPEPENYENLLDAIAKQNMHPNENKD